MYAPLMPADQKSRHIHAFHPGSLRVARVVGTGVRALANTGVDNRPMRWYDIGLPLMNI